MACSRCWLLALGLNHRAYNGIYGWHALPFASSSWPRPSPDCSSWKPPSDASLPASYYQCVSSWKEQGEMNIAHAGCSIESLLKQIRKILDGEGRDLAVVHAEQPRGQGSRLGQSAPVSCRGKELVAAQLGFPSPWKAPWPSLSKKPSLNSALHHALNPYPASQGPGRIASPWLPKHCCFLMHTEEESKFFCLGTMYDNLGSQNEIWTAV